MSRRGTSVRVTVGALVLGALALPLLALGTPTTAVAASTASGASGAVTESGTGRFADLKVTLSQSTHLRNQVVRLDWKGGRQTTELTGNFNTDYLQVMQCWGGTDGPRRETCQFGGLINDTRGGSYSSSRQVSYGANLVDPQETYRQAPGVFEAVRVPFEAVNGTTTDAVKNEFYDQYSTNEIPYARTAGDGTGTDYFEVQTGREAPGLGCGQQTSSGPRSCWLVVVPRDDVEVNGKEVQQTEDRRLVTSPLSASNWQNRIAFKLSFDPLAVSCPLGEEQRLLGNEDIVEAVTRWQPALCNATGSIFGYSQLSDSLARNRVAREDDPWMSIVNDPIPTDALTDGRKLAYAPVGINGIGIAVNIDRQPSSDAPDAVQQQRGSKVLHLNLNQRLVAKLLTQSYNLAALSRPDAMAGNPLTLTEDPEFWDLNPEFKVGSDGARDLAFLKIRQITNPLGLSDANRAVWAWIASDRDARRFLAGKPDKWGMVVNPNYQGMSLDRDDFPRADLGCRPGPDPDSPSCPLDALAYAADFHDAGRAAARGDTLERGTWDPSPPKQWKKNPLQLSGERQVLALVDTATAARYQLPMASLQNGSGEFVAPTTASLQAGLKGLKNTAVPGVQAMDPTYEGDDAAYPLTGVSYAVTAPAKLTAPEAKAYSRLLRYITTQGQVPGIAPGRLPEGYLPLPAAMRKQAAAAATLIAARGGAPAAAGDKGKGGGAAGSGTGNATSAPSVTSAGQPGTSVPVGAPAAGTVVPVSSRTPSAPAGGARYLLLAALVLGVGVAATKAATPLVRHLLLKRGTRVP